MDAKEKAKGFYEKLGLPVVPLTGKAPKGANTVGWQEWSFAETHQKIAKHTGNIGIRLDNLVVLDNDDPTRTVELFREIETLTTAVSYHGNRNPLEILKFRERGHSYYAKPDWLTEAINYKEPDAQGKLQTVFEIRTGAGQQCVAPPSVHPDGTTYKWYKPELLAKLPEFPRALWEHVQKIVAEKEVEDKIEQVKQPAQKEQGWKKQVVEKLAGTWASFYQEHGITGIKTCRKGQMQKGYTEGQHHHAPGFSFFPDTGYFVDFYSGQRGFPQDYLAGQNGGDKEKAWQELAQCAQVETSSACKYCGEKGDWKEIEGRWKLLVNGKVHNCRSRKPTPAGEKKETRKRLTSAEYLDWLTERGWHFSLCALNDEVYTDSEEKLTDVALAQIQSYVLDRAIAEKRGCSWEHCQAAIVAHAAEYKFNPIADYFNRLRAWDGKDYLGELCKYIKAEAHFRRWLEIWTSRTYLKALSLIDFNPALVLKGGQNLGKSYLAWSLCPEPLRAKFFFDGQFNFEDKDCLARQTEVLVWEHQEAGFAKRDINLLKDFLSKKTIRWRSPWGKKDKQKPAISSFIFTINETGGCLVDEENRRFHVVAIQEIAWEYSLVPGLMEGIWSQVKARATELATITKADMEIRDGVNEQEKVCDPVEVILERAIEITGSDQDFLPLEEIIKSLAAHEIKPSRATTMSVALFFAQLGLEKARGYVSQDGRKIQVRGYRGCRM